MTKKNTVVWILEIQKDEEKIFVGVYESAPLARTRLVYFLQESDVYRGADVNFYSTPIGKTIIGCLIYQLRGEYQYDYILLTPHVIQRSKTSRAKKKKKRL